jgi:D-alanyl-D-alanine carboxypeptidase
MALLGRTSRTTAIAALRTVLAGLAAAAMLVLAPLATAKTTPPVKPRYAAIVVDGLTGEVLHAEHADALRYPASLTKMMTLFMIFEALDRKKIGLDSEWKVSAFAAGQSPTKLGLQAGRTIAVRDVILGLVTKSANDAAVVAAENLAGTEPAFAAQMTERARPDHHRRRHGPARARPYPQLPAALCLLLGQPVQLRRHDPPQPQPVHAVV